MRWVRYPFYLFGKIIALAFIFVGGGVLAAIISLALALFPGNQQERAQFFIHVLFRFYLRMLQLFGLIRLEVEGTEKFPAFGGTMVIANHPSLLDVVILMALIPKTQCIVKHELWERGLLGGLMRCAGYIRNDLDPETLVQACKTSLDDGRCLIIFPEGTRTSPGSLPRFQRGFANIATLTKTRIQPIFIDCSQPFLFKGEPWWHAPPQTPCFRITIGECLDANTYSMYGQRSIATRKLVELLELYYADQMRNRRPRNGTQKADH
jgi:1-acyl-sn-glycerol-3-phosphate acyltransferase